MAESTVVRTKRDAIITISDSGASHSYTVAYEPGDSNWDVPLNATNLFLDRGVIGTTPSIRKGDDQPCTFGFSAYQRDLSDVAATPAYATLADVCIRFASDYVTTNWTSTLGTNSDEFTVTVAIVYEGSDFGGSDQTLTFAYSVVRVSQAEGDPNTLTVAGTSYQLRPTIA